MFVAFVKAPDVRMSDDVNASGTPTGVDYA
jgi:hypothetical protein